MKPLQAGLALSATIAISYALCALAEVLWPKQFIGFMNALFHGLDFQKIATAEPSRWPSFFYALVVLAVWGFAVGAFYAWLHGILAGLRMHRVTRHERP